MSRSKISDRAFEYAMRKLNVSQSRFMEIALAFDAGERMRAAPDSQDLGKGQGILERILSIFADGRSFTRAAAAEALCTGGGPYDRKRVMKTLSSLLSYGVGVGKLERVEIGLYRVATNLDG